MIISRPNVTVGENLGYLPGNEKDKLKTLLVPMLNSIDTILGPGSWSRLQAKFVLELQSFAYIRGRAHTGAFVIADEVQNARRWRS